MKEQKSKRPVVKIHAQRGADELLPLEVLEVCAGTWVQEIDNQVIEISLYPETVDILLPLLARSGVEHKVVGISEEENRDYVALMKKHFTPISVGDIIILPPWRKSHKAGSKIIIEPGMAFGTGRHESTKIMLRMLSAVTLEGMGVLDIGCGSGILAIYAHMRGARRVVAIDHDLCASEATQQNAALNNAEHIEVVCADLNTLKGPFDVVLANLDARTFSECSAQIVSLVDRDGLLLISGIEIGQKDLVLPLFSGLRCIARRRMKDWYGFTFQI